MTDLLPCPFCGSSDNLTIDFVYKEDWCEDWCVECDNCHVGQHALWPSKEHAIQKWNTRANKPAALDEKIKRYEDALYYLIERADDSNDARYGTLSASFVRDVCSKALDGTE